MFKISIITPSYNQGTFLKETLHSIIEQDYHDIELIVIDGGSTDNSPLIIEQHEKHISYWTSERDSGQSNAINKGFKMATGDVITWINSDDLLLPGALSKVAEHFKALPESIGVIHGGTVLYENNKDLREVYTYGIPSIEKYLSGMAFSQPAAFFRRSYLEQVGLLREDLHYGMDYDLFARLACVCRFQPVDTLFSKYRLHDESKSVAHSNKFRQDWNRVFLSICRHLEWKDVLEEVYEYEPQLRDLSLLNYNFAPDIPFIGNTSHKKLVFYFLCDLVLHYYWYDEITKSRLLYKKMRGKFPRQWFKEDQRVVNVIRKLQVPESILRFLKKAKHLMQKS